MSEREKRLGAVVAAYDKRLDDVLENRGCGCCGGMMNEQLEEDLANALEALKSAPDHETQCSITAWQWETFPAAAGNLRTYALRMLEEAVELCLAADVNSWQIKALFDNAMDKAADTMMRMYPGGTSGNESIEDPAAVPGEIADVAIVLYGVARCAGVDLHAEVDKKMKINRARQWRHRPDGHADHVREGEG